MTQYVFEAKVVNKMLERESDVLKALRKQFKHAKPVETLFSEYGNGFVTKYYVEPKPEFKKVRGMFDGAKSVYPDEANNQRFMLKMTDGYIDTLRGSTMGEKWCEDYDSANIELPPLDTYLATVDIRPKNYLSQSKFEVAILKQMASNTSENIIAMETQIENFDVESRDFTGVGFFTKFKRKNTIATTKISPLGIVGQLEIHYSVNSQNKADCGSTVQIFVLWQDEDGFIDTLEGFAAYGQWREDYENAILEKI